MVLKADINFAEGCWSWLECYQGYATYSATFYTYLEIPM
jgi:hypothetical protein